MAEIAAAGSGSPSAAAFTRPYAPSWFDRLTDWVDRLPFPAPVFYLGLALVLAVVQIIVQSVDTTDPTHLHAFPLAYILTIPYLLGMLHFLDRTASDAMERFRPVLIIGDPEYADLHYRLTTLPARPTLLATLLGTLIGLFVLVWIPHSNQVNEFQFVDTALSLNFNHALGLVIGALFGIEVYHTIHQLRIVQDIYNHCKIINLYALRPLYALSALSTRSAFSIIFISYLWYVLAPMLFEISVAVFVFFTCYAFLVFMLPMRGIHRLLVAEKDRKLGENGEWQRSTALEVHRRLEKSDYGDMDALNKAMASLELEHTALERISTWPWQPGTIRTVIAALLFPVVVWLMQWVLERLLAGG
jgi:hypothetical protein